MNHKQKKKKKPMTRFELVAFPLPRGCATSAPHGQSFPFPFDIADGKPQSVYGGQGWIRTNVA